METIRTPTLDARPGLQATAGQLRALGVDEARIARGERIAALVAAHSNDPVLLAATQLAQAAAAGLDLHSPTVEALWNPETLRLAAALNSLAGLGAGGATREFSPQQAEATRKMLLAVANDPRLILARLAEQLLRLQEARGQPPEAQRQLGRSTELLFAPLANRLGIWNLKWELEDLAFRYQHPADYQAIATALAERRVDRERYIADLCVELQDALARAGIQAEVYGRPKHIYSIWRKMQRKQLAFGEVFDVRALRIVVANVADCYAALGLVHGRWPYIPSEFDDYIATPKGNDYRSIHTAVTGPGGKPVEIQIRTREMHEQAELGVAAHWRYKEGGGRDARYEQKIEWARRLLEPQPADAGDPGELDYLDELRRTLFADRIYVLTPKGDVIDLPRGATALDFAYHVHTSLGHRCRGARANGRIVALDTPLANGAIVEVIAGRSGGPSRDWLNPEAGFLASARSRAKVRAWFHQQDEVARAATHAAPATPASATPATATAVANANAAFAPIRALRRKPTARRSPASPVLFEGVDDLPSTLARCCGPVPPLAIAGYLTLGRGVTVHRAECPSLARMAAQKPDRVLRARWNLGAGDRMPVRLRVEAFARRDLLRDVSDLLAQSDLWLDGLDTRNDAADRTTTLTLDTAVHDQAQLDTLLRALARLPSVISAGRID